MPFRAERYRIIGDSHVHQLAPAAKWMADDLTRSGWPLQFIRALAAANEFYESFIAFDDARKDGIVITQEKIRDRLVGELCDERGTVLEPDATFSFISFGFHTQTFLASKRFETHRYWRSGSFSHLQPVSDQAFATMVVDLHHNILQFSELMRNNGHRFAILESPPLSPRNVLFGRGYASEDVLLLDDRFRAVMRQAFHDGDIPVIAAPAGTSENGLLKPEYLPADPADTHHANDRYGRLVLAGLADICGFPLH